MLYILIVLYKKAITSSLTLQGILNSASILNQHKASICVWDNSPEKMVGEDLNVLHNSFEKIKYKHTPGNSPLSVIYNTAIESAITSSCEYLILLDDDSKIDATYFEKIISVADKNFDLIVPVVKNRGVIRSPMRSYIIKGFPFSHLEPGLKLARRMMAINSGMVISRKFLEETSFRYDLRLRNYSTDSYFMKFYATVRKNLYVLDYTFDHSLSFFDTGDLNRKLTIFKEAKHSNLIVYSDNYFNYLLACTANFFSSVKYSLKHRTLRFFK